MKTKTLILLFLIVFSSLAFGQTSGGPDNYGYTWKSSDNSDPDSPSYSWIEISATGTNLNLSDDSGSGAISLNGDFYFYGNDYSTIFVGSNGWVNFLQDAYSPYHPFIYTGGAPNAFISPFGEDLNPDIATANVYIDDDAGRCVIQYDQVPLYHDKGAYSFQIVLNKNDSTIVFNYKEADASFDWHYDSGTGTAVTGIENESGTTGLNIDNSVLKDNFALKFYQPAPYIYYDPDAVNFENIWVGKADSTEITLLNSGKTDLILSDISLESGTDLSLSGLPAMPHTISEINSGSFLKFYVKYTPSSENTLTDKIIIQSNSADENSTLEIPVSATSLESQISVLTPAIDFGNVQVEYKDVKDMNVIVRNDGNAGLIIEKESSINDGSYYNIVKMPSSLPFIIAPNSQDTVVVRFTPTAAGLFKDTLSLFNNTVGSSPVLIPLNGTGVESEIGFTPQTVAFDSTIQGTTDTLSFKMTNTGAYKLSVNSMQLVDNISFSVIDTPPIFTLNPGEFRDIKVGFTPLATGFMEDSIRFSTNLPDIYFVKVSGTGILPNFNVDPEQIAFGQVILNVSKTDSLDISNSGIGDLVVNDISFEDGSYFSLNESFDFPFRLESAQHKRIHIDFLPTALGYKFDGLKVTTNLGVFIIQLQGKGIFPDIEVSANEIEFGKVQVDQSKTESVYLENSGTADLIISSFDLQNGSNFSLEDPPSLPLTIQPYNKEMIKIKFTPDGATTFSDLLSIHSNAQDTEEITLSGTGTFPGISLNPAELYLDSVLENSSSNLTFWIKNTGSQNLHISSLKTKTDKFEVYPILKKRYGKGVNDLEFNIAAEDSQQVRVEFSPDGNQFYADSVVIDAEFIGISYLPLTGQGTRAEFSLSSVDLDFGDALVNTPFTQNIILTSTGNGILEIQDFENSLSNFTVKNSPALPVVIFPGEQINFDVEFKATDLTSYLDTISVITSSTVSAGDIKAEGNGIGSAMNLSSAQLNFGDIALNATARDSFYVKNYGNRNLNISGLSFTGEAAVMNIISPTAFPVQILPGDSDKVVVGFTPVEVKNYAAAVKVLSDGVFQDDTTVILSGDGISADIFVNPSSLDFEFVHLDSFKIDSVAITNTGNADLLISALTFDDGSMFSLHQAPVLPLSIAQGATEKVFIKFTAETTEAEYNDLLTVVNNSGNNVSISMSATAAIGKLEVSSSQLDFGSVNASESATRQLTVSNTGNYKFTIDNITATGDAFTPELTGFNPVIEAGDSSTFDIVFNPQTHNDFFEILKIESEFADVEVSLQGKGLQAVLSTKETEVDFGNTEITVGATRELKVFNSGNIPLTITGIPILGGGPFSITGIDLPYTIDGEDSTTLNLNFNPASPLAVVDSLHFENSSSFRAPLRLLGLGLGSSIQLSETMMNFGESVTSASKLDTLIISNSGNKDLTVSSLSLDDETAFAVANYAQLSFPLIIAPAEAEEIIISFTPPAVEVYSAKITLVSDSYDKTEDFCTLLGSGIAAGIEIAPDSLVYDVVKIGEQIQKTLTLTNDGNSTLFIDSLVFKEDVVFSLAQSFNYPIELNQNESLELGIVFSPQTVTVYRDSIFIYSNTDSLYFIPLAGAGGIPELELSVSALDFAEVTVASDKLLEFYIRNNGNYKAEIDNITNEDSHFYLSYPSKNEMKQSVFAEKETLSRSKLFAEIPAYDSLKVRVRFKPTAMLSYLDTIVIAGESEQLKVALSAKGVKAILQMSENMLNYGSVRLGLSGLDSLDIVNTGNTELIITQMELSGSPEFIIIDYDELVFPLTIAPLQKITTAVQFIPLEVGNYNGRIKFSSNNFGSTQNYLYLAGSGETMELQITPDSLDFGQIDIGNISVKTFKMKNTGNDEITINGMEFDNSKFVLQNLPVLPYSIMPGAEIAVDARFQPQAMGLYLDTVKITTSVMDRDFIISGIGAAPLMRITQEELDFDSVFVSSGKVKSFYIVNDGTSDLDIEGVVNNSTVFKYYIINSKGDLIYKEEDREEQLLSEKNLGQRGKIKEKKIILEEGVSKDKFVISGGDSVRVQVTFTPKAIIDYEGDLQINTNVGSGTVALAGKGAAPFISISEQNIVFDDTQIGNTGIKTIMIQNNSALPVMVDTLVFVNSEIFTVGNTDYPFTILGNSSKEIELNITPQEIALYRTSAVLINNSGMLPRITLSGSGRSASYNISKLENDFGSVSVEDEIKDTLRISNTSLSAIVFDKITMAKGIHFEILTKLEYPYSLSAGQNLDLVYCYKPKFYSQKILSDSLRISGSTASAELILSGKPEIVNLKLSATEIDFGSVTVNDSSTVSLTVENMGLGRVVVDEVLLQGGLPFDFDDNGIDILLPGESKVIDVKFKPKTITLLAKSERSLSAPANPKIDVNEERLLLSWDFVEGATGYNIYTSDESLTGFREIGSKGSFSKNRGKRIYWSIPLGETKQVLPDNMFFRITASNETTGTSVQYNDVLKIRFNGPAKEVKLSGKSTSDKKQKAIINH